MKSLSSLLLATLLVFAFSFCASASDISCSRIPELQHFDLSQCDCGKNLSRLPITAPQGMSLIAACGYKKEEFVGVVGEFYFMGNATVKGEVKRVNSLVSGGSVLFNANAAGNQNQFRSAILSLRFGEDSFAIQKFKLPSVSEQLPCMSADAVIRVKLLHVKAGYESDEEGSYPQVFEVLKVGPYRQCKEQEEDQKQKTGDR